MDPKNLNKNNLACGGVNFGSLSLISFSVAAAQVGSSSSSFLFSRAQELSGVGPAGAFLAGAFGGDWGSRPEKEISDEQRVHFPCPPHFTAGLKQIITPLLVNVLSFQFTLDINPIHRQWYFCLQHFLILKQNTE